MTQTIPPAAKPLILTDIYSVAGATVPKADRYFDGSPNQDSLDRFTHPSGEMMVAAVFDGCGSQPHSHIGSHMGGRLLLRLIYEEVAKKAVQLKMPLAMLDLQSVQRAWGKEIERLCRLTGGDDWKADIESRFEFTVVGVIMTQNETMVFHAGDGYFGINGKVRKLESPKNAPSYPIYPFLPGIDDTTQKTCWIKTEPVTPTSEVQSIILATDGAEFLPKGISFMAGYQTSDDLRSALAELQVPKLESTYTEPTLGSKLGKPEVYEGDTRVDIRTRVSFEVTAGFSASLKRGLMGDDVAVVVITRNGSVRRHTSSTSAATASQPAAGGSLLGRVGGFFGIGKGDGV